MIKEQTSKIPFNFNCEEFFLTKLQLLPNLQAQTTITINPSDSTLSSTPLLKSTLAKQGTEINDFCILHNVELLSIEKY